MNDTLISEPDAIKRQLAELETELAEAATYEERRVLRAQIRNLQKQRKAAGGENEGLRLNLTMANQIQDLLGNSSLSPLATPSPHERCVTREKLVEVEMPSSGGHLAHAVSKSRTMSGSVLYERRTRFETPQGDTSQLVTRRHVTQSGSESLQREIELNSVVCNGRGSLHEEDTVTVVQQTSPENGHSPRVEASKMSSGYGSSDDSVGDGDPDVFIKSRSNGRDHHPGTNGVQTGEPAGSTVQQHSRPLSMVVDVDNIDDEEQLQKLLNETTDFDDRKIIRNRLREVRQRHAEERDRREAEREKRRENEQQEKINRKMEDKAAQMKYFEELAKQPTSERLQTSSSKAIEDHLKEKVQRAEEERRKENQRMEELSRENTATRLKEQSSLEQARAKDAFSTLLGRPSAVVNQNANTTTSADGSTTTTQVTKTVKTADGQTMTLKETKTTTTHTSSTLQPKPSNAAECADTIASSLAAHSEPRTWGRVTVTLQQCVDGQSVQQQQAERVFGQRQPKPVGAAGARQMFAAKDKEVGGTGIAKPNPFTKALPMIRMNANQIKQEILAFCQRNTSNYKSVDITNFSSSWANGMAFCALIHHFVPDAFDFNSLNPRDRKKNFDLAFRVAEERADIAPLLEVEDMLLMGDKPDWKCVFCYVQSIYRRFRNEEKRPEAST